MPRPWPRRSGATTSYCWDSGSKALNQFNPPLAIQPCSRSTVGAPGGPCTVRTKVVPRPGSSIRSPNGSGGPGITSVNAMEAP